MNHSCFNNHISANEGSVVHHGHILTSYVHTVLAGINFWVLSPIQDWFTGQLHFVMLCMCYGRARNWEGLGFTLANPGITSKLIPVSIRHRLFHNIFSFSISAPKLHWCISVLYTLWKDIHSIPYYSLLAVITTHLLYESCAFKKFKLW